MSSEFSELDDLVPVHSFLLEQGFSEVIAAAITLQVILKSAVALPDEILEAAEAIGYSLPDQWGRLKHN